MIIPDGPIIQFTFSAADVASAVQPALAEARRQSQSVSNSIAQDWQRMAANIRATLAQGLSTDKEITQQRTQLLSIIDRQLSGYRQLTELSKAELTNQKALTLERERQQSFLKNTGGLTAGTSNALNQVSQQTVLGLGRILDSLVNRYLGGAAGAAVRTGRDLYYYNSLAKGSGSDAGGIGGAAAAGASGAGGILSGVGGIVAAIPEAVLAVGSFATVLATLAAAGFSVTKSLADTAQAINNTSASTGLSTTQVQVYGRLASEAGIDPDSLTNAFSRLQVQIGEYVEKGKTADESTQAFIRTLNQFGISVTNTNGTVRSINDDVSDFANVLQAIPDKNKAVALSMEAFGVRGKAIVDVINQATLEGKSLSEVFGDIQKMGDVIPESQLSNLQKAKNAWDDLWRAASGSSLGFKEGIAGAFLDATGINKILANAPGPRNAQQNALAKVLQADKGKSIGSGSIYLDPEGLKAEIEAIADGSTKTLALREKETELSKALAALDFDRAKSLANQVVSMRAALENAQKQAEVIKSVKDLFRNPVAPNSSTARDRNNLKRSAADVYDNYINGPTDIIGGAGLGQSFGTDYLAGVIGPGAKSPLDAAGLLQQINKEHEDLFKSQAQIDAEHYQDELDSLNQAHGTFLISDQEYYAAKLKLQQDANKTLNDANKKFEDQAGSLFDDLISGNTKGFTTGLLKNVENIALGPVKQVFEQIVGSQLNALAQLFSGKPVTPGTTPAAGGGSGLGGIFGGLGGILGKIGLGGTPGFFPGAVGNGPGGGVGQPTLSTNVMDVRAQVVNIASLGIANSSGGLGGGLGLPGASGLLGGTGGFGSFFGNLNPFGGSGGAAGGPVGGIGGALGTLQNVFSKISPYAAGAATLGIGLATGNETAMALGAATLAGKAATALSGLQGLPSGLGSALGSFGAAAPGIGIGASGVISAYQSKSVAGKIGGTLEAGAGGALAGLMVGGPIGAAIGGAIGLIGGTVASILGGNAQGFQQGVTRAMSRHGYVAPPSENFSFASNGSIANTLGTGFYQSGNQFQQYGLGNTPFWANALTGHLTWQQKYKLQNSGLDPNAPFLGDPTFNPYVGQGPVGSKAGSSPKVNITLALPGMVDAGNISTVLAPHITKIAALVSNQVTSSAAGFGSNARRAVFLP